jgi:predicted O-methyltransferase YrrM
MLRGGAVLSPRDQGSRAVAALNDRIQKDERVKNVLLPIRDGIMVAYRR